MPLTCALVAVLSNDVPEVDIVLELRAELFRRRVRRCRRVESGATNVAPCGQRCGRGWRTVAATGAERIGTHAEAKPVHAVEVGVNQELHVEGHVSAVYRERHAGALWSGAGRVGDPTARHWDRDITSLKELG